MIAARIATGLTRIAPAILIGTLYPLAYAADPSGGAADGCHPGSENERFWQRLVESFQAHLFPSDSPAQADTTTPATPSGCDFDRVTSPPESNPRWPYAAAPIGGTELIGYENLYSGALMDPIWCGPNGREFKGNRFTTSAELSRTGISAPRPPA